MFLIDTNHFADSIRRDLYDTVIALVVSLQFYDISMLYVTVYQIRMYACIAVYI